MKDIPSATGDTVVIAAMKIQTIVAAVMDAIILERSLVVTNIDHRLDVMGKKRHHREDTSIVKDVVRDPILHHCQNNLWENIYYVTVIETKDQR